MNDIENKIRRLRNAISQFPLDSNDQKCFELEAELVETKKKLIYERNVGAFSGLTKRELALTRTCETDWA